MKRLDYICREFDKTPLDVDRDLLYILDRLHKKENAVFEDSDYRNSLLNFLCNHEFVAKEPEPQSLKRLGEKARKRKWVCFKHSRYILATCGRIAYNVLIFVFSAIAALGVFRNCS